MCSYREVLLTFLIRIQKDLVPWVEAPEKAYRDERFFSGAAYARVDQFGKTSYQVATIN